MGKLTSAVAMLVLASMLFGCAQSSPPPAATPDSQNPQSTFGAASDADDQRSATEQSEEEAPMLNIQVGDTLLQATLEDNSSAAALVDLLREGPLTISLHDYGNFEKVGPLDASLPTNDQQITTEPGDVILYQGSQITIYYDQNTWNFTRLAKIENATREDLLEVLGQGDIEVTLSLG